MTENTPLPLTKPRSERAQWGKSIRQQVPRSSHGQWQPAPGRSDPLDILLAQDEGRLSHLLPIKYGRMAASPFAFLRGSAAVMAHDLAQTPVSGIDVILCGDAHLSNFGLFASPERDLIFDINDFDEVYPGPWEWDLKRLAASAVVAGRENGFDDKSNRAMVEDMAMIYQTAMRRLTKMRTLDVWYFHIDAALVHKIFDKSSTRKGRNIVNKVIKKARTKTHERTLDKLTHQVGGKRQFISEPPLLVPLRTLNRENPELQESFKHISRQSIEDAWVQYLASLPEERRRLLQRYSLLDVALRVGGVGSVGTRCFIFLFAGGAEDDAIILQLKESGASALAPHLPTRDVDQEGHRVITGQRLMQAASDIFLGWHNSPITGHDYYWRQFKDMKGSFDVAAFDEDTFITYLGLCSVCLARAHARTGDEAAISGYLGKGKSFGRSLADFAVAYADQTEQDQQKLLDAIESGRIIAEIGI